MRIPKVPVVACVLLLSGCPLLNLGEKDEDKIDGTSSEAAATALTKSASFVNGDLVAGLLPETTLPDVTLLGEDATGSPGETTLLSFDAVNPDQSKDPVTAALMQFVGSDQHFEVLIDEPVVDGENVSFELELELSDDVCSELCNQVFDVQVTHALKTDSGGIGDHGELTLKLDCTEKGNPDACASSSDDGTQDTGSGANSPTGGDTSGGSSAPATGERVDAGTAAVDDPNAVVPPSGSMLKAFELITQISAIGSATCGTKAMAFSAEYTRCVDGVINANLDALQAYNACVDGYYQGQLTCVQDAGGDCTVMLQCPYFNGTTASKPHLDACGTAPANLQAELDACDALNGTAGTAGNTGGGAGSTAGIDAGTPGGGTDTCGALDCQTAADLSSCSCILNCGSTGYELKCAGSVCQCMMNGSVTNTFDKAMCSDTPNSVEWTSCGFPIP